MVDQLVGITLSGCKIIKLLGKGGMGSVFLGRQVDLGRFVAVKILSKNLIQEEGFLRRFKREARSVASLSHPNIVQVYQYGEEDGIHFIVMEYIEGETLGAKLIEGAIDEQEAIKIAKESALALAAAHEKSIVHRDIKPDNIILSKQDETKVTDFGLAKQLSGGEQQSLVTKQIIGTPAYISPEQIKGAPIDPRSDVYSLGATIYHAVAGKPPFSAKNPFELLEKHLKEKPVPPNEINEEITSEMSDVILKCLEKDPKFRYQSPEELIEDLERLEKGEKPIAARRSVSLGGPLKLLAAAALVAIIVLAGSKIVGGTSNSGDKPPTTDNGAAVRNEKLAQARRHLEAATNFEKEENYEGALRRLREALELLVPEDKEFESTKVRISEVQVKKREKEEAVAAENLRKERRAQLTDLYVEADREDVRELEKLLASLEQFLESYPDDEKISGLRKRVIRRKGELDGTGGGTENGSGTGGETYTPGTFKEATANPQLVDPLPLDYEAGNGEKPPTEGEKDGEEKDEDGDEGEEYPDPPFKAAVFLKRGGGMIQTTVVQITETEVITEYAPGQGRIVYKRSNIDRIEPDDDSIGRVGTVKKIEIPLSDQFRFTVKGKDTKTGHLALAYDFNDIAQKADWEFKNGAVFNPQDRSVRLGNNGIMEFKQPFKSNVQVEVRLTAVGRTGGKLQVGIYSLNVTLSTSRDEPPAIGAIDVEKGVWSVPPKVMWPPRDEFPRPYFEPDEPGWIKVRRIAKQIYLEDLFSGEDKDILMPKIRAEGGGGGKIAIRAVGGTFVIEEVKITGTPFG